MLSLEEFNKFINLLCFSVYSVVYFMLEVILPANIST